MPGANVRRDGTGSPERRGWHVPIAYAIGLPDGANVRRDGIGSPERRGWHVPIAHAIGLPDGANVRRDGTGSPEPRERGGFTSVPYQAAFEVGRVAARPGPIVRRTTQVGRPWASR